MLLLLSFIVALSSLSLIVSKEFFINKHLTNEWSPKALSIDQQTIVRFRIALFPSNAEKLKQTVNAIADPKSKVYHHYLSNEEITTIVQPSEKDLSKLFNWVRQYMHI